MVVLRPGTTKEAEEDTNYHVRLLDRSSFLDHGPSFATMDAEVLGFITVIAGGRNIVVVSNGHLLDHK